jgi:4-amino-4-deoxy-L-arabinose transferase-like glycosyltransferase
VTPPKEGPRRETAMKRTALLPIVLAAAVYLPTSGGRGVIDYDEGYYSQPALRMAESGDWVTPYADGVRFLEKPPLMYWVTAASLRVLGRSEFALRLPTALAVVALVWVITRMAQRAAGPGAGLAAGLCAAFSVGTCLFTREALHDVWLVLFVSLGLYAFLEWYRDPGHPRGWALLFYASLAGGFMTKSLVGVALPVGIAVVFFLTSRERPGWRRIHLLPGSLLFLALAAPWHVLAAVRNPGFLQAFFLNEQILRFLGRHDPPVLWSVPLLTFWALVPVWFFPWTAFVPAAVRAARTAADGGERALARLALAWAVVVLGFFSFSGRLEHYVFPALPALSLLVGTALARTGEGKAVRWGFRALAALGLAVLMAGAGAGLWLAAGHGLGAQRARGSVLPETDFSILAEMPPGIVRGLVGPAVVTVAALAIGFAIALRLETRGRRQAAVLAVAAVMVVFCGAVQWSLTVCEDLISSKRFGLAVAREARPGDHLVVVGDYESANSVSFYQPLPVQVFDGVAYALVPGMKYPDAPRVVLTRPELEALWRGPGRAFALVPRARPGEWGLGGTEIAAGPDRVLLRSR